MMRSLYVNNRKKDRIRIETLKKKLNGILEMIRVTKRLKYEWAGHIVKGRIIGEQPNF